MPLPPGGLGVPNAFVLIAHFRGVNPVDTWRSELHIFQSGAVPQIGDPVITAAIAFWRGNLRTDCFLDHLELRNAVFGNVIFSMQAAIWTDTLNQAGTKVTAYGAQGANAVGKEVAAYVRISNTGPKLGKAFLRQLLDEGDIAAVPGAAWVFLQAPQVPNVTQAKFLTLVNSSGLSGFFGGASNPHICVVHFSLKEWSINPLLLPFTSPATAMNLIGPTVNKATRKSKK